MRHFVPGRIEEGQLLKRNITKNTAIYLRGKWDGWLSATAKAMKTKCMLPKFFNGNILVIFWMKLLINVNI